MIDEQNIRHYWFPLAAIYRNFLDLRNKEGQLQDVAFSNYSYDKINVSLPKKFELKVALTPTKPNVDEICTCCCGNKAIIPRTCL